MAYTIDDKINAVAFVLLATNPDDRKVATENLRNVIDGKNANHSDDPKEIICEILTDIGTPDHIIGHPYLVEAILMCLEDRRNINSITLGLYPQIAAKYDTTATRVERAIRHAIEVTFIRADYDVVKKYFGNTINPNKGKPTNGEFISRVANIARRIMK